jgi:cobalamin biosynthesis protein CobC
MASIKSARNASVTAMNVHANLAPLLHGGDLAAARRQFPDAPEPLLDLSTGINPDSYPLPQLPADAFARLPDAASLHRLAAAAARAYGAPSGDHVVAAPGTQILLPLVAGLSPPGRARILGPTYAEHLRVAALVGHRAQEVATLDHLAEADFAVLTNPNNPDGRIVERDALIAIADALKRRGGFLVVDEAFMDVSPVDASLAGAVDRGGLVVLRSFGKFFGLAGLRLGFALAAPPIVERLAAMLGPWAVSGPAIAVGTTALADVVWANATRTQLAHAASRLDALLAAAGLDVVGGTSLFRLVQTPRADGLFDRLGRGGIIARRFAERPTWLRFGLPHGEDAWRRLHAALAAFR